MRVVHLSTDDIGGGAAVAAFRIHRALCGAGIDSVMLVGKKLTDDARVVCSTSRLHEGIRIMQSFLDSIPFRVYNHRWSTGWLPTGMTRRIGELRPDVLHLHLVSGGLFSLRSLRQLNVPIVWTMHDMWAFTGGCHYSGSCTKYSERCGACPLLSSRHEFDMSRIAWSTKSSAVKNVPMTVLGPSRWIAQCAEQSSIFQNIPVKNIPYVIDPKEFKPVDQRTARAILGLPFDRRLLLFGGMSPTADPRKGYGQLLEAMQSEALRKGIDDMEVVVFGASRPDSQQALPVRSHFLGRINDTISLNLVYSAADAFVAPSLEENLANTVLESLACGTPVVAFRIGGMPDMIRHTENGYLAEPLDSMDLAEGIRWVLSDKERSKNLRISARHTIEAKFNLNDITNRYIQLYREMSTIK